jgi:hypothetical protein
MTRRAWRHKPANKPKLAKPITKPGQVVSVDQIESSTPGFFAQGKGALTKRRYVAATVFVDVFSSLTYIHLMESLSSVETVEAKEAFERYAKHHGVEIMAYHAGNGRFADNLFKSHVETCRQKLTFCGVDAHHQNGIAERRIRDITESAQTMLLHAIHRWPKGINAHLWPYALRHTVNIRNSLPRTHNGTSPVSSFSQVPIEPNLSHFHPFGCPVYVLEGPLRSLQIFPKWNDRSKVGIHLCHSPQHASSVPLILNPATALVSPQFHVVFDDNFDTVLKDANFDSLWQVKANLCDADADLYRDSLSTSPVDLTNSSVTLLDYSLSQPPQGFTTPWSEPVLHDPAASQQSHERTGDTTTPSNQIQISPPTQIPLSNGLVDAGSEGESEGATSPPQSAITDTTPATSMQYRTRSGRVSQPNTKYQDYTSFASTLISTFGSDDGTTWNDIHPFAFY